MAINDYSGNNNDQHKYLVNVFINGVKLTCFAVDKDAKGKQAKLFASIRRKMDAGPANEMQDLVLKEDCKVTFKTFRIAESDSDEEEEDFFL